MFTSLVVSVSQCSSVIVLYPDAMHKVLVTSPSNLQIYKCWKAVV
jgi:hypothetical protein